MAKPKLALIPATQGTKLYSVLPADGVGDFTFSRGSAATRINKDGLIETVAVGKSRLNYPLIDGVVNGCPSHLLEPSRTNIIPRSEDIDTNWSKSNATVANNQTISPNGTLNAGLVTATSTSGQHILYDTLLGSVTAGADYFISCFVKKSTTRYIRLNDGYAGGLIYIDLDTNSIISENGGASESIIENYGNGWFRVGFKFTADSSGNSQFALYVNDNSNNNAYAGSGEAVYVFGAQLEQGSYPTSYIPTTNSAVTRVAETANGAGDASTFNDSEGVLMVEISALVSDSLSRQICINGASGNSIRIIYNETNNTIGGLFQSNGVVRLYLQHPIGDIKLNHKVSVKYKVDDFSLWIDGFKVLNGNPLDTPVGLNAINFDDNGTSHFYGNTKQIQYFDSALTDAELTALTTI
mgnify:CR=1 FL=1